MPQSASFEGQHVVDTVAGHGHGVALPLEGAHQLALLVGGDPAEDGVLPHRAGDVLIGAEGGGVHVFVRPLDARLAGHLGDGDRVVAGDDLHGHPLLGEVAEGLGAAGRMRLDRATRAMGDTSPGVQPL